MAKFRFKVVPTAAALIFTPLTFGLGVWQVDRHFQKMGAHHHVAEQVILSPLKNVDFKSIEDSDHWKRVELQGSFQSETALIGGKTEQSQPGYNLMQVFKTTDGTPIMVERGWLPREGINEWYAIAQENATDVPLIGQLRPIRHTYEMEPVEAKDFPASVWRPASQGELHRRWLPDEPFHYVVAGPMLRPHQSRNLETYPYSGWVPTPEDYSSFLYAIHWFVISIILLAICIGLGFRESKNE